MEIDKMKTQIQYWISGQCKRQISSLTIGYVTNFLNVVSTLLLPILFAKLIGDAVTFHMLKKCTIFIAVTLLLFSVLMLLLSNWVTGNANNKFSYSLKEYIWNNNLNSPLLNHRNRNIDADFQIITLDSDKIGSYYFNTLPGLFSSVLLVIGSIIGILFSNYRNHTIIVLVATLISFSGIMLLLQKVEEAEKLYIEDRNEYLSFLLKVVNEIRTLKLFAFYEMVREKITTLGKLVTKRGITKQKIEIIQLSMIRILQYLLLVYGLFTYIYRNTTMEDFILYEQYIQLLCLELMNLIKHLDNYKKKKVVAKKLNQLFLSTEHDGTIILEQVESINVEHISFKFNQSKQIFYDFTYTFQRGKCYLLKAKNGFGKTTLLELIAGIEIPEKGIIRYNNIPLSTLNLHRLRRQQICYLMQDEYFRGSNLQENIDYYLDNVRIKEFDSIFKKLSLTIDQEKGNFNTTLSGGQKKKLAIAIMMKKIDQCTYPIIFMDEPTNMLDSESVRIISSYIEQVKRKSIILLISHNDSFDSLADRILFLDQIDKNLGSSVIGGI